MVPLWVDARTALLVVLGGLAALVGSLGLLRLGNFFQRAHAPTLGATLGTWSFALATAVQLSFVREQPFLHALLIPVFIALTAPITTIFHEGGGVQGARRGESRGAGVGTVKSLIE